MANPIEGIPTGAKLVAWGIIAAVGIVLLFILWPITMIGGTEAGIVLRNKAIHHTLPPDTGLALRVPLIDQVVKADLTIQTFKMTAPVYSKDSQIVDTTVTVNYKVDPGQVEQAYRETQLNYEAKLISPNMPDVLESSLSAFTANDLVDNMRQR
ncbi:MAG: hypothetical protein HYR95_01000 [Candidatus Colwellbacteria bacterium]|nr:hypothetical protein [Candidatus Colwellbacteria bacterium]